MSGFSSLVSQATLLLAISALLGVVIGWSFGSLRASRLTTESYERQMRATLRRMSDAEAEAVTLRGKLDEYEVQIASQAQEHESREHLLAALEARLSEAEGAAEEAKRRTGAGGRPQVVEPTAELEPEADTPEETTADGDLAQHNGAKETEDDRSATVAETPELVQLDEPVDTSAPVAGEPDVVSLDDPVDAPTDDLTRIRGIGKVISGMLAEHGVTTYEEIAGWSEDDVEAIEAKIEILRGRVRRDDWINAAAALHEEHHASV